MTVAIRSARPDDAESLHDLVQRHADHEGGRAPVTVKALRGLIAGDAGLSILVAEDGGRLTGYVALTFDWSLWTASRYAHMDCLFVSEAYRNAGTGALLMQAAMDVARGEGAGRMEWQTPDWNRRAERFYLAQGARSLSKLRFTLDL